MNGLGGMTARRALIGLALVVVVGGIILATVSYIAPAGKDSLPSAGNSYGATGLFGGALTNSGGANLQGETTDVVNPGSAYSVSTTTTVTTSTGTAPLSPVNNNTQGSPGGSIEFSSQVDLQAASPQQAASEVVALAYSVGGYVAYQSAYSSSASVVIRVPAADYQQVLTKVQTFGRVASLTSNSNDVTVQYTDLNATLESLQAEQGALLRLLNESTSINSTLAIETQLQEVNAQINDAESQILQTRTLISFSTINVAISEAVQPVPLSMNLTAIPKSGEVPLSVTFNAVVKGGAQPYVVNFNFGDGYGSQGQIVIHTYYHPGDYNVTVTATDQNGTSVIKWVTVHATAAPGAGGVQRFLGTVSGLFISVVQGIIEVAVVVLPIAAVGAAVIIPLQRRSRGQKPRQE